MGCLLISCRFWWITKKRLKMSWILHFKMVLKIANERINKCCFFWTHYLNNFLSLPTDSISIILTHHITQHNTHNTQHTLMLLLLHLQSEKKNSNFCTSVETSRKIKKNIYRHEFVMNLLSQCPTIYNFIITYYISIHNVEKEW